MYDFAGTEENEGRLTLEQFSQILTHISGPSHGPLGLICRFIDSDGDGLISMEDIFLAELKILQKDPDFLKVFFRYK